MNSITINQLINNLQKLIKEVDTLTPSWHNSPIKGIYQKTKKCDRHQNP